jgi:hypothetical protein
MAINAIGRAVTIRRAFLAALARRTPEVLRDLAATAAAPPALSAHTWVDAHAAYERSITAWCRRWWLGTGPRSWIFGAAYHAINTIATEYLVDPASDLALVDLEIRHHARERTQVDFERGFAPPKRQAQYRAISSEKLAWKADVAVLRQVRGLNATQIAEILIDGDQEFPNIRGAHLEICGWCDIEPRKIPAHRPAKSASKSV